MKSSREDCTELRDRVLRLLPKVILSIRLNTSGPGKGVVKEDVMANVEALIG